MALRPRGTTGKSYLNDPPVRRGRPPVGDEIFRAGRVGGVPVEDLAEAFGTPVYVYDLSLLSRRAAHLRGFVEP